MDDEDASGSNTLNTDAVPKKKASPHCNTEDNTKTVNLDVIDTNGSPKGRETYSKDDFYHKGGLVNSLHGDIYQLKVLMLFLKRALDRGYEFQLGAEVEDANKFDDIVFKRKDENGQDEISFVQVKHKQDKSKKITVNDLTTTKGDFSLQKYFISYRNIRKNPKFSNCKLKDFIIYTNIDFSQLEDTSSVLKRIKENNGILTVKKSGLTTKRYKLKISKEHVIYEKLRETSDLHVLVKKLKQTICTNTILRLKAPIFKLYHKELGSKILDISSRQTAKVRVDFLNGENLSEDVRNFREVLQSTLKDRFKTELKKSLKVSKNFGQTLNVPISPTITGTNEFAKIFANVIIKAQMKKEDVINVRRIGAIKPNIDKLACHILVQDEYEEKLTRFRKAFFNDNQVLEGNLEQFKADLKQALTNNDIDFDTLGQYKFKIARFITCEETPDGELLYPKDELPNDKVEDEDIEDFLRDLVFAVNQPNEDVLGEIITEEMGQSTPFNLLDANLVSDSFLRIMLDWLKEKRQNKGEEGVWLNRVNREDFLDSIEQRVSSLIAVGINVAYPEKLATHGIRFNQNNVSEKLKTFLSDKKKIFHVMAEETMLSALNVYSALEELKQQKEFAHYGKKDSYIFICSSELKGETQKYIKEAFKSKHSHHLLIIDCNSDDCRTQTLDILSDIKTSKKIILIAKKCNILIENCEEDNITDICSYVDFTEESQKRLLEKEVIFQGKKVILNELIKNDKAKDIIDVRTIVKLLRGEEIRISDTLLEDLDQVNCYYIARRFRQEINVSPVKIKHYLEESKGKSDLFVISGSEGGLINHGNVFIRSDPKSAERRFNKLCDRNAKSNIHWLKSGSKNLTWQKTNGSICNLLEWRIIEDIDDASPPRLFKETELIRKEKIIIISDISGMGKSTVLTNLSMGLKKEFSGLWVIRINLIEHTEVLNKFRGKRINDIIKFISNDLLKLHDLEEKMFCNYEKRAFLFDGFDEVCPDYKDIVIYLLKLLSESKVKKIFVTTRPNMRNELERSFEVFSYSLQPFSKKEQTEFLTKFWTQTLKIDKEEGKLEIYVKSLIQHISKLFDDAEQGFIGIPLQTMMLAEVFLKSQEGSAWQGCKEFLKSKRNKPKLLNNYFLLDFYDCVIEKKFYKIFLREKKLRNLTKPGEIKTADKEYKTFKNEHSLLALKILFNKNEIEELLSETELQAVENLIEYIKSGEHNYGIVDQIINDKPHFIHHTFAEYFAPFVIVEKILAKPAYTLQWLHNVMSNQSRMFIDSIIKQLNGKQDILASLTDGVQLSNFNGP